MRHTLLLLLWGCGDPTGPDPVCPWSSVAVKHPPGQGPARAVDGTTLLACQADGRLQHRWVERYPSGAVAAEGHFGPSGAWDGVVTVWAEDGAFVSSEAWVEGARRGPRRFVGPDGRIVEVDVEASPESGPETVTGLRVAPFALAVDEWDGLRRVTGTAYRRDAAQ